MREEQEEYEERSKRERRGERSEHKPFKQSRPSPELFARGFQTDEARARRKSADAGRENSAVPEPVGRIVFSRTGEAEREDEDAAGQEGVQRVCESGPCEEGFLRL